LKKVAIITSFPRAHRVGVYNEMAKDNRYEFNVFYLRSMPHGRHWEYGPKLKHNHKLIKELRIWKHLYLSPRLLREFVDYNPDMMIMTQYASPGMQLLMYYCSIRKIPWVFWSEAPNVRYEAPFVKNELLRTILRKIAMLPIKYFAKEVWGIGNRAIDEYKEEFGLNKIYKNLPYYSDLREFSKAGGLRKNDIPPTFLFSGSLSYRKGADLFAKSIESLAKKGYEFHVIVMGVGEFSNKLTDLKSFRNIEIDLLGFVQLDKVPEVYSKANILVFPSRHDGWGMTLPEGMAAGMAVISTPYTGCAIDTINDNMNGVLVNTVTSSELEKAMESLINHPTEVARMGEAAKRTISSYTHIAGAKKFNSMINKFLRSYSDL